MSNYYMNDNSRMSQESRGVQNKIFVNPNYTHSNVQSTTIHINPRFTNTRINTPTTTAHINPLFINAHINPHFKKEIKVCSTNIVHVNPKLFNTPFVSNKITTSIKEEPCIKNAEIILKPNDTSRYSYVSNRKLIKKPVEKSIINPVKIDIVKKPLIKKTRNKLIRLHSLDNTKQITISKNNILSNMILTKCIPKRSLRSQYAKKSKTVATQYKLDRRLTKPELNKLRTHTRYTVKPYHNRKSDYRTKSHLANTSKKLNDYVKKSLGIKYLVQKHGKTLKRIKTNVYNKQSPKILRISTNKDKKILCVTKSTKNSEKLRVNNVTCLVFRRFGICKRHELGRCFKVHDKKQVDICKEFLAGKCVSTKCLLSHEVSAAKMPICLHYLAGVCGRDNCPYPHIKHSLEVPVCKQFLRGYCEKAEKCDQRHVFMCPDFDKNRICPRMKCPYPHGITKSKPKLKVIKKLDPKKEVIDPVQTKSRYYVEAEKSTENIKDSEVSEDFANEVSTDENEAQINQKRPALGVLPSYIPI